MTQDDVLFGYRLQLFDMAARTTVTHACRTFGVHRSTYYAWKAQVDRQGLEMLRPRERRRPVMPNQFSAVIEQRIVAFALGHPGLGPKRISAQLARPEWGALLVSPNGVYKVLVRHGLNTRAKRLALVSGYRAPCEPPRAPEPEPHVRHQPSGRAGRHRLLFRRAPPRNQGPRLADHSDRHLQLLRLGGAGRRAQPRPDRRADLGARPASRAGAAGGGLAAGARAHGQRRRVRPPRVRQTAARRRRPQPDPRRPPPKQRPR